MPVPEISVEEAAARLAGRQPPHLVDVREAEEWSIAHVPGAELVPLSEWPGAVSLKLKDPARPLLILCHHGSRSARATEFLLRVGFADVTNVAGGIDAWSERIDPEIARY